MAAIKYSGASGKALPFADDACASGGSTGWEALRWSGGSITRADDRLAAEEPLEIRLSGQRFTLTMRTPGHDEELATGFLFAEGFISSPGEIEDIQRVRGRKGEPEPNAVDVILRVPVEELRERLKRNFTISASCGVCGKTSIDALTRRIEPIADGAEVRAAVLLKLGAELREAQKVFDATGGLHASGLFDFEGRLTAVREDIGRHNAVDKVVGWALRKGMVPLSRSIMMVSGRASFEIVQKAGAAGVPILVAISAASSLAAQLADELGMTLVGFLRDSSFNVYTHENRILP